MATVFASPLLQLVDANGNPYSGAKATFYVTGTTTGSAPYSDAALSTPHDNPVVADSTGTFAPIYLDPNVVYKVVLTTSADVTIRTIDPANGFQIANGTPASATATGTAGEMRWDSSFLYICTSSNTWKRVAIATW